jgi:hypothetical protein
VRAVQNIEEMDGSWQIQKKFSVINRHQREEDNTRARKKKPMNSVNGEFIAQVQRTQIPRKV